MFVYSIKLFDVKELELAADINKTPINNIIPLHDEETRDSKILRTFYQYIPSGTWLLFDYLPIFR